MNKLLKSIVCVATGLAMAIGVGVGLGSEAKAVYADTTNNVTLANGTYSKDHIEWNLDDAIIIRQLKGSSSTAVNSSYISAPRVYKGHILSFEAVSGFAIKSISITVNGTYYGNSMTAGTAVSNNAVTDNTSEVARTWTTNSGGTHVVSSVSNSGLSEIYIQNVASASNVQLRFSTLSITYSSVGGPTVSSVTVNGSMSNTSYTTAQPFSNAGLSATVTMSNDSTYGGSISWTFDPATPGQAFVDNNNENITNLTVTATASAGGVPGSKATGGISVTLADVAQGLQAIPNAGDEVDGAVVLGTISHIDEIDTTTYHNATYYISDDGSRDNELKVYRGKFLDNANFSNSDDIQVGDVVLVYGSLKYYNGTTKEFLSGNYLLDLDRPISTTPSITITEDDFTMSVGDSDVAVHATATNIPEGGSVSWGSSLTSVATVSYDDTNEVYKVHAVAAGEATVTASILDNEDEIVVSDSITVTVIEPLLAIGDTVVFYYDGHYLTDINTSGNTHYGNQTTIPSGATIFTVAAGSVSNSFAFEDNGSYLCWTSGNSLDTKAEIDDNSSWTITGASLSNCVVSNVHDSTRLLEYNTGSPRFACYTGSQRAVLIEKVDPSVTPEDPEVDEITLSGDTSINANNSSSAVGNYTFVVSYVNPSNPGTSEVTIAVSNGASASKPSNGGFTVTFTANGTYTITVESKEDNSKTKSLEVTVSGIYIPVTTSATYEIYSGTVTDGDYIIVNESNALKASISSDRAENGTVTVTNNSITTDVASIIWHISKESDGYYRVYNESEDKYLASNGKNKAQLLSDNTDDRAKWIVTAGDGVFSFENLARSSEQTNPENKWLRNNGQYGWACYGATTGVEPVLYKKSADDYLKSATRIASLRGTETVVDGQVTAVTNITLRFGIKIPKVNWDCIDNITEYGVMMYLVSKANESGAPTVKQRYDADATNVSKSSASTTPAEDGQGNYNFIVVVQVPDQLPTAKGFGYNSYFIVRPYVMIGTQIHWLLGEDMHESIVSLAEAGNNTNLSEKALTFLASK